MVEGEAVQLDLALVGGDGGTRRRSLVPDEWRDRAARVQQLRALRVTPALPFDGLGEFRWEAWRAARSYPGLYASTFGRIRSMRSAKPRPVSLRVQADGYRRAHRGDGVNGNAAVVVADAWHGPRPPGAVVDHIDGRRDRDSPLNLRWVSPAENVRAGRLARLSENKARAVLLAMSQGVPVQELAAAFGVSRNCVRHIWAARTWWDIMPDLVQFYRGEWITRAELARRRARPHAPGLR